MMTMTRENFIDTVTYLVKEYMNDFSDFDSNPQIRVNPATLGLRLTNGSDMLDFYPVKAMLKMEDGKRTEPDTEAIRRVAEKYF